MKTRYFFNITSYYLSFLASSALFGETFTLNDYSAYQNWSNEAIWDIAGETTQTFPQNGGDVIISNPNQSVAQILTIDGNYKIDSLSVMLKGGANHYGLTTSLTTSLEIANDSTINASFDWFQFMLKGSGSFDFKKNLTINNNVAPTQRSMIAFGESASTSLASFNVGGNLDIQQNGTGPVLAFFNSTKVNIGGNLKIGAGANAVLVRSTSDFESALTFGGIEGNGILTFGWDSYNAGYSAKKSVANVTIKTGSSWSGKFVKNTTNADSRLNLTMDGTGTQDFRVTSTSFCTDVTNNNVIDTLTVSNGTFNYYTGSAVSGKLVMQGGKFGAAASAAPENGFDIGTINFASGEWSAGAFVFEIDSATSFDKIVFSSTLTKSETDLGRVIELAFDADTMSQLIELGGGVATFANMITYSSDSNIEGTIISGTKKGFNYSASFGDTAMTLTVTVPEPANVAVLFGAAAILAAFIVRRRK